MNFEYFNVLKALKEDIISFFVNFDVCFAFEKREAYSAYLKPCVVLDASSIEEDEHLLKVKADIYADEGYDLTSDEVVELLTFISDNIKYSFPAVISVSLSSVESANAGRFKKRSLEMTVVSDIRTKTNINGIECSIASLSITEESGSRYIYKICDERPVGTVKEKSRIVGFIKNCSLCPEKLGDSFGITYKGLNLKNCVPIYIKGEDFIKEAKFLIGSIE